MADLQEPTDTAPEPSMEEILASIRKIIADENSPEATNGHAADVVELTQMVQDDGSIVDLTEAPAPEPWPPAPPPVVAAESPSAPPAAPTISAPADSVSLMSDRKIDEAASVFSSLANTVAIDRLATGPAANAYLGNGSRTLEDMVIELMRPMLKQWLDQNLPATVDRLVQKEVERIARRAKD